MMEDASAYTVMIVEDELLVRVGLHLTVPWGEYGMQVVSVVEDGVSAWDSYQCLHPNIILTDIRMPGMNGVELVRHIRQSGEPCEIIVITCIEDFDTIYQLMRMDITGYLLKATMVKKDIQELLCKAVQKLKDDDVPADTALSLPGTIRKKTPLYDFVFHHKDRKRYLFDCEKNGLPINVSQFCILVRWDVQIRPILKSSITNIFQKRLVPFEVTDVFSEDEFLYVFLMDNTKQGIQQLFSLIQELVLYINDVLDVSLRIVVCNIGGSIDKLAIFAGRGEKILGNAYFYPDCITIFEANLPNQCGSPNLHDCTALLQNKILVTVPQMHYQKNKVLFLSYLGALQESIGSNRQQFEQSLLSLAELYYTSTGEAVELSAPLYNFREGVNAANEAYQRFENAIFGHSSSFHPIYGKNIIDTIQYIWEHIDQNITLSDLSSMVCLSPNYYSTLFKQTIGCSFSEYLGYVRIDKACDLLSLNTYSIQSISVLCGFSDATYFSRFFKQKVGISPHQWRITK